MNLEPRSGTWYQSVTTIPPPRVAPEGRATTGVAVIGGGLAGLCTALALTERGVRDVMVLERERLGQGASGRNGGFVFAGYSLSPEAIARRVGLDTARRMIGWTMDAVREIDVRCRRAGVAVHGRGVVLADWFGRPESLHALYRQMVERYGMNWAWLEPEHLARWVRSPR
ncbi:MAG: hypothetical protein Kow0020_10240 [Wenzhouxiangellaceae bacterium]